jgi:hypothetical protein
MWKFFNTYVFFPGWTGIAVGLCVFLIMGALVWWGTKDAKTFFFENKDGDFEEILKAYLDIAKFILTLAAGGIVLIISSTSLGSAKKLPATFAAPLFILVMSMFYGVLFMPLLVLNYEAFKNDKQSYTRLRYVRNQTLGFASLGCFCVGYAWLIYAAAHI